MCKTQMVVRATLNTRINEGNELVSATAADFGMRKRRPASNAKTPRRRTVLYHVTQICLKLQPSELIYNMSFCKINWSKQIKYPQQIKVHPLLVKWIVRCNFHINVKYVYKLFISVTWFLITDQWSKILRGARFFYSMLMISLKRTRVCISIRRNFLWDRKLIFGVVIDCRL